MNILRGAWVILAKDMLIEWRTRARLNALLFFSLATLFLFSFAGSSDTSLLRQNAAGYLWLAVLFASVLSMGESFRIESENSALDGLRLAPADPRSIYLGKAWGNAILLWTLAVVLVPFMIVLYDVSLTMGLPRLLGTLALGALAISAPGTIHASIASNARARDVLLPVLLFPLLVPALLSAVRATALVIEGDPMDQLTSWVRLLIVFNVIYWGLGFALFPRVIED